MRRLDNDRQHLAELGVALDDDHLCARNHDVAYLQIGDLQHPFQHCQGFGIEERPVLGLFQQRNQLAAVSRLSHHPGQQAFQPAGGERAACSVFVHLSSPVS